MAFWSVRRVKVARAQDRHSAAMETKDTFMRFVVIGSIVVVGALAFLVRLQG
jgi:K+-transporting ATPase A subunit